MIFPCLEKNKQAGKTGRVTRVKIRYTKRRCTVLLRQRIFVRAFSLPQELWTDASGVIQSRMIDVED